MRTALLLLAAAASFASAARAQPSAEAEVDRDVVAVGEEVRYTLTLRGGRGLGVEAPTASSGLKLLSVRPVLDATSTINGETERRLVWLYEATREGRARIDRVRVRLRGELVSVESIPVQISGGGALPSPNTGVPTPSPRSQPASPRPPASTRSPSLPAPSGELFVRAEPSARSAYVGQQVVVDYVLYFRPALQPRQTAPVGTWDAAGFWREEMDVPSAFPRPVTLGGERYEAVTIRRVALFPTRTGTLSLAPMEFEVDLLRAARSSSNSDPFAPFFSPFSSRYESEDVTAPPVTITARALPPGAPPTFGGAVGQFGIASSIDRRAVRAGDPVRIEISLSGTGNVSTIEAPELDVPPGVDAYAPRNEKSIDDDREPLRGRQTFTYTLVPQGGGDLEVPPAVWSYFDPSDGRYKTLRSETFRVAVDGEAAPVAAEPGAPGALLTQPDWRARPVSVGVLWGILGGGLVAPALALLLVVGVRRGRERMAADTPERRARRAPAEVQRRLRDAHAARGVERAAAVERAVRLFLRDRWGLGATVLSRPEIAARLGAVGVPDDALADLDAVLERCNAARYAPAGADDATLPDDAAAALERLTPAPAARRPRRGRAVAAGLVCLVAASAAQAGPPTPGERSAAERAFVLGLELAAEGDTTGAVAAFEAARAGGASAAVEHNLARLHLGRGDAGRARLAAERAYRLAPDTPGVPEVVAAAREAIGIARPGPVRRAVMPVVATVRPLGVVGLALLVSALAGAAVWWRQRLPGALVGLAVAVAALAVVGAGAMLTERTLENAVVLDAVAARGAPSPEASEAVTLTPGQTVHAARTQDGWTHLGGGVDGWVPSRAIGRL